jgi:hypothetical protein
MILIWKPREIARRDFLQYKHCWARLARKWGEEVVSADLTDSEQNSWWDRVNSTPGRFVIWVRPEFVPLPAFSDEVDVYREEGQLIILLDLGA